MDQIRRDELLIMVSGCFNILHPGHIRLLKFAKECGGRLVVAVESDSLAGGIAHVNEKFRLQGVQSISIVDDAFIYDTSIVEVIDNIKPDIVVKGKEHEAKFNEELESLKRNGGRLIFSSGQSAFSSLELLQKEFDGTPDGAIKCPKEFLERKKITSVRLRELISKLKGLRVAVVGDIIVDEYISCEPLGMSQEEPTIVVMPTDEIRYIGGAGIVAAHAKSLGADVNFYSVIGDDDVGRYVSSEINRLGVDLKVCVDISRPTTLKKRYRSKGKSLLRVTNLHQGSISKEFQNQIYHWFEQNKNKIDVLIFSDFNYGCLPQDLVDRLIKQCQENKIFMAADSQSSSQLGDIGRYKGVNMITPTEREARVSMRNTEDGLVVLAEKIRQQTNALNVFLKMGEEGLLIHSFIDRGVWDTDRITALNSAPKDVAGAGDSLLVVIAMIMAAGGNVWEASYLGSVAAAVQVGRTGNIPLTQNELLSQIEKI
jgi:rfaE bifunctional protein kinase chain/domain